MKDFYVDFDIKNAQPEIMNNICSSNNIELTAIKEYCNNRDQILKDVMNKYTVDRKTAKNLFLSLGFFGNFDGWTFKNKIKNRKPTDFINNYVNDIHKFYEIVKEKNETLYNTARKKSPENTEGSMLSLYLQEWETRIMESVIYWLCNTTKVMDFKDNKDYKIGTYEFDGVKLLKENKKRR